MVSGDVEIVNDFVFRAIWVHLYPDFNNHAFGNCVNFSGKKVTAPPSLKVLVRLWKDVSMQYWKERIGGRRNVAHQLRSPTLDAKKGKQGRGQTEIIWWQTAEKETKQMAKTLSSIQVTAKDRQMWKDYVVMPHALPHRVTGMNEQMTTGIL